jgi:hypothetical protein
MARAAWDGIEEKRDQERAEGVEKVIVVAGEQKVSNADQV